VSKTTDKTVARVADHLKARMQDPASQAFRLQGDYHHWPEQWATDSVHVAAAGVFPSELDSGCVILDAKRPHPPVHVQSRVVAPAPKGAYPAHQSRSAARGSVEPAAVEGLAAGRSSTIT